MKLGAYIFLSGVFLVSGFSASAQTTWETFQNTEYQYKADLKKFMASYRDDFAERYISKEKRLVDLMYLLEHEISIRRNAGTMQAEDLRDFLESRESKALYDVRRQLVELSQTLSGSNNYAKLFFSKKVTPDYLEEIELEFERVYALEYELAMYRALKLRELLLNQKNAVGTSRLFQGQLETAMNNFRYGDYSTAALELADLYETFLAEYSNLDDVAFYAAEAYFRATKFSHAERWFNRLIQKFSSSEYRGKAAYKLVVIAYILEDHLKTQNYIEQFEKIAVAPTGDNRFNKAFYLAGSLMYKTGDYNGAIRNLEKITNTSQYYGKARYLVAQSYAGSRDYKASIEQFKLIVEDPNANFDLKNSAQLKIALMTFEDVPGGLKSAKVIPEIDKVSPEVSYNDLKLLLAAWAQFKDNNIVAARMYVDSLLLEYPDTEYLPEIKTLRGNIQVLDPVLEDEEREILAIGEYNYVANAREAKAWSDKIVFERDSLQAMIDNIGEAKRRALILRKKVDYVKLDEMERILSEMTKNDPVSRLSRGNSNAGFNHQKISTLISESDVIQARLVKAQQAGDKRKEEELSKLLDKITTELVELGFSQFSGVEEESYSTKELDSVMAGHSERVQELKESIAAEKFAVKGQLDEINRLIRVGRNTDKKAVLEEKKKTLMDIYEKVLEYERWIGTLGQIQTGTLVNLQISKKAAAQNSEIVKSRNEKIAFLDKEINSELNAISIKQAEINELIRIADNTGSGDVAKRLKDQKNKLRGLEANIVVYRDWLNTLEYYDTEDVVDVRVIPSPEVALLTKPNVSLEVYFSKYPHAYIQSQLENHARTTSELKGRLVKEKAFLEDNIDQMTYLLTDAKNKGDVVTASKLEFERNRLESIYQKISDYELWMNSTDEIVTYADLNSWGDFATYGKNNITYVISQTKQQNIEELSRAISQIDKILADRKKDYENTIAKIEEELTQKEMQIREKELEELRAAQKEFFETEYFDVKETEKPEDDPFDYKDLVPEIIEFPAEDESVKKSGPKNEVKDEPKDDSADGVEVDAIGGSVDSSTVDPVESDPDEDIPLDSGDVEASEPDVSDEAELDSVNVDEAGEDDVDTEMDDLDSSTDGDSTEVEDGDLGLLETLLEGNYAIRFAGNFIPSHPRTRESGSTRSARLLRAPSKYMLKDGDIS